MAEVRFYNFLGSYNKAYKNKNIDEKDFNAFLKNLRDYFAELETVDKTNEELLKNIFNKHLLSHYQTLLNENRIDLSIKKDNKTQVIFEFKSPNNKSEMLQTDSKDVNKKALQEAIWYFYNQDSKEISYNIKNVVITDTEHLFFFNPKQFCNKDLEKICLQYRNNQVAYTNTKTLYDQIGSKIKEKNIQFEYAEFNLIQYKAKILNNSLNDNDKRQLQYLYKALHSDFLLREYSPKDSNELNAKFYNELLYILGLKEEGKNQKKIVASDVKGTLRDRIVYDLSCKKFDDIINLIIVWLNRLLFLKLFESQLISFNNNNKSYAFLNFEKNPNFAKLNRLFFNILGKPLNERDEHEIPYLNSSLFERAKLEKQYGNISDLDSEATLSLCKGSILSKVKNYPKNPKLLKYLLDFLEAYNFSSNVSDKDDKKDIINSSVLGLIFEKLNGYKDGSFFTPAYITEYMAETSINNIILQKFNNAFTDKAPCETIEELKQLLSYDVHKKERRDFYNKIIDSLKICDPAVGSGHFLVSVLNYIVALKSELGLLPVPNKIEIQNDSLVVYEQDEDTQFEYKRNNQNSLIVQKTIFDEKRKIIENCLFGVDINPNSVQICCLRLWIELLKNTYYIGNTDEMQILPNIDINIKCGNSLTSNIKFEIGKSIPSSLGKQITEEVNKYKKLVKDYKNSSDKEKKNDINNKIIAIYKKLEQGCAVQLQLIEDESIKYNLEQANAIAKAKFNAMHGSLEWAIAFPEILDENGVFNGFDIIIANPPYGLLNKKQNQKISIETDSDFTDFLRDSIEYKSAITGMLNIYKFFILRGFKLLKQNGFFIQIFPLAFACDSSLKELRKFIFDNYSIIDIEAFPERDSTRRRVFEHAKVSVCIVSALRHANKNNSFNLRKNDNKFVDETIPATKLDLGIINELDENLTIPLANASDIELLRKIRKISKPLSNYAHCYTGEIDLSINAKYITDNPQDSEMIKGAIIDRYLKRNEMSQGEIQYLNSSKYLSEIKTEKTQHHNYERIVMQGLTGVNERHRLKMTIIPASIYCANSVNYLYFKEPNVNKKYILGLLNSSLLDYIFKISSTNSNVNGYEVDNLPIIIAPEYIQHDIQELVNKLLEEKQKTECNNVLCDQFETEINKIIYELYNLTTDEINRIENS